MKSSKIAAAWLMGASLAAISTAAFAQTAPAAPADTQPEAEEEVVIVTATKREQTLQSVPVAVSVTSADTINKAQVRDLNDLQTLVPSLRISTNQSSANSTFIIRGFGNGANNAGIEPSVAVFIDGVYRSRAGAAIGDLPNLQRVEVLRGPQSTLFGKNASAGVISVVTREPKFELGGSAEVSYGNFNAIVAKADITGPLGEKAAGAFAFGINKRDGYVYDENQKLDVNNRDRYYVRGDLLIEASENLKVRAIIDHDALDEICCAVVNVKDGPTGNAIRAIGGRINSNSPFSDKVQGDVLAVNEIENSGISVQVNYERGDLSFTSISSYRNSDGFSDGDIDFTSAGLASAYNDIQIKTLTQEFRVASDYDGPVNFLLGAYLFKEEIEQKQGVVYGKDFRAYTTALTGGASSPLSGLEAALGFAPGTFQKQGTGTTEKMGMDNNAQSVFGTVDFEIGERLTFTGGFNYTKDSKRFDINIVSTDTFSGLDLNAIGAGLVRGAVLGQQVGAALRLGRSATTAEIGAFAVAQPAAFAQINAGATAFANANAANPSVNTLLGLRGLQFQPPFLNIPNAVEPGRTNDSKTTWSARLAWEVNDNWNAYASYSTGFKASSVNLSRDSRPTLADFKPGNPITNPPPSAIRSAGLALTNLSAGGRFAGPEEATVAEVGIKASFPKGAFNITLFDQQIDGFQSNTFTGTGFVLANAGTQSTTGIEADASWRPIRPLTLTFAMTLLDPLYDDFKQSANGDLSGVQPAGIAEVSFNVSGTWTQPLSGGNRLILRADYFHEGETRIADGLEGSRAAADPYTREVNLLNAGAVLALSNGWELTAWGRNLTDDRFLTAIFAGVAQAGTVSGYPSQPRTYGVSAKYIF
jgi:iron complex outermembrane recepter protein